MKLNKNNLKLWFSSWTSSFKKDRVANVCGHRTKMSGEIVSPHTGEKHILSMPASENGNPDYCLRCIEKMEIRCTWCGKPISIGDPVTLYTTTAEFNPPDYAVRYSENEKCFVGCLRLDCADTGADRQGFWIPPGTVMRVPSPFEIAVSALNERGGDGVVVMNNLTDPGDTGTFFETKK